TAKITDTAGNTSSASTALAIIVDTTAPTIAITSNTGALKADETATITFTFNKAPINFTNTDVVSSGGTLSTVTVDNTNDKVYTATFTPASNSITAATISVANDKFEDAAGNKNADGADANNSVSFTIDTVAPTLNIVTTATELKAGQSTVISFIFTEPPIGFTNEDIVLEGGTLSTVTVKADNDKVYTATFTPSENSTTKATISVGSNKFEDAAGNKNTDGGDANNSASFTVNTIIPTVAIESSVTTLNALGKALITFTFSETPTGFDKNDIVVVGGGTLLSDLAVNSSDNRIYTIEFRPEENSTKPVTISVASNTFTNTAGNFNTDGGDANNSVALTVDAKYPDFSSAYIDSLDTKKLTLTFDEALTGVSASNASGFSVTDNNMGSQFSSNPVTKVEIANGGHTIVLTLENSVAQGKTVKVTYNATSPSIIKDLAGNSLASISTKTTVVEDATIPKIIGATNPDEATITKSGDALSVEIIFSEVITLVANKTATITLVIDKADGGTQEVTATVTGAASGGTTASKFTFVTEALTAGLADTDGIKIKANSLVVTAGDLKDETNNVKTTFDTIVASNVQVDTMAPTIKANALTLNPINDDIKAGDTVTLTIALGEDASHFTGLPTGNNNTIIKVAGSGVTAVWSQSGSNLILTYTVASNDSSGGITINVVAAKVALASLKDQAGNSAMIANFSTISSPTGEVDTAAPTLHSTTLPTITTTASGGSGEAGTGVDDTVILTVTFDTAVNGLTSGTVTNIFTVGGSVVNAIWGGSNDSDTRTLTYTVVANDNGVVAINEEALRAALLNASITDKVGNAFVSPNYIADITTNLPTVDTTAPLFESVAIDSGNATTLTLAFNEALTFINTSTTAGFSVTDDTATTGTFANNAVTKVVVAADGLTAVLTLTSAVTQGKTVKVTYDASDATIKDKAGNALATVDTPIITTVTDVNAPHVASATNPSSATIIKVGQTLSVEVTFNATIKLAADKTATITLVIDKTDGGTVEVNATVTGATTNGTTNTKLTFTTTTLPTDLMDTNGIRIKANSLSVVTATDLTNAAADSNVNTNFAVIALANIQVDTTVPTITNITSTTADDSFKVDEIIALEVSVSENMNENSTIVLTLETGTTDRTVTLTRDSTDAKLYKGVYTVQAGDTSADLSVNKIETSTGADAIAPVDKAGNALTLTLPTGKNLNDNKAFVIDTTAPVIKAGALSLNSITDDIKAGDTVVLTIELGEDASNFDSLPTGSNNDTIIKVATTAVTAVWSQSGTNLLLTYTVKTGDTSGEIAIDIAAVKVALGSVKDKAGNEVILPENFNALDIPAGKVDTIAPIVTKITSNTPDDSFAANDTINLEVSVSENMNENSTIVLTLETGTTDRTVTLTRDSTDAKLYKGVYTVQAGDTSADLSVNKIETSTGADAIAPVDKAGNALTLTLPTGENLNDNRAIIIDNTPPVLHSTIPPMISTTVSGSFGEAGTGIGDTVILTVTFDEKVNGLVSGTTDKIFMVGNTKIDATWGGIDATNTRTLTYTIVANDNGAVSINETALKSALKAGISDLAGNDFVHTGAIADITANLPTVDTTAPAAPTIATATVNGHGNIAITTVLTEGTAYLVEKTAITAAAAGATITQAMFFAIPDNKINTATITSTTRTINTVGLLEGDYQVYLVDKAGNISTAATNLITIDTTAPAPISSNAWSVEGHPSTFATGDEIKITLTLDSTVILAHVGSNKIVIDGKDFALTGNNGDETTSLVFKYTVKSGDSTSAADFNINAGGIILTGVADKAGNAVTGISGAVPTLGPIGGAIATGFSLGGDVSQFADIYFNRSSLSKADVFSNKGFTGDGFVVARLDKSGIGLGLSSDDTDNTLNTIDYA
ncbi:MAG: hypothetical protein FE834_05370, partial [Gammaproteobacteria bacterium]|nr:hypothetical protein [Gammaproteobacteria bacterium]